MIASFPIILMFAGVLAALLTGIFVFEAFVTELYTGPGQKYIVRLFVLTHINFNPTSKRSHLALQSSLSPLYLVS